MNASFADQLRSRVTDRYFVDHFIDKQLVAQNIRVDFPQMLLGLTEADFSHDVSSRRKDLRSTPCLTIDCSTTQDMDDAIGVERVDGGYRLRVHIADVADFVGYGSPLDKEAMLRGTSVYLPGKTIPMLPPVLTDELCSLRPGVDRKAVSVEILLDGEGDVVSYEVCKSLIRSELKGVYSEVNAILGNTATNAVLSKYGSVLEQLFLLDELATKLNRKRVQNGAETGCRTEPTIVFHDDSVALVYEESGAAESMVEECMVLANTLIARYFAENGLPSVLRCQVEKGGYAAYTKATQGHVSLALDLYAHFTSPIRRLSDLRMHQILSDHLAGATAEWLRQTYGPALEETCVRATKSQRCAKGVQRAVSKFCLCRYFEKRACERYTGKVAGVDCKGRHLVLLNGLGVSVVAPRIPHIREGMELAFRIAVNWENRSLYARGAHAVAVCS